MSKTSAYLSAAFGALVISGTTFALLGDRVVAQGNTVPALSTVLVDLPHSLGSGVYIGNGKIITAAHVVSHGEGSKLKKKTDEKTSPLPNITVRSENGSVAPAHIRWIEKDYDVAVLDVDGDAVMETSDLACRKPVLREDVEVVGNPLGFQFIHTFGKVARSNRLDTGEDRNMDSPKEYFFADVMLAPGNSGGPLFDSAGKVLGIINAMLQVPTPPFGASLLPLAFATPSLTICNLLQQHEGK